MSHCSILRLATVHTWVQIMICRFASATDGHDAASTHAVSEFAEAVLEQCSFSFPTSVEHPPRMQGTACGGAARSTARFQKLGLKWAVSIDYQRC